MRLTSRLLLCLFICCFIAANSVLAESQLIQLTVTPSLAPNAYGSPSFSGYSANAMHALQNGLSAYGDPNLPTYYSSASHFTANQPLVTSFNSWMGSANPAATYGAAYAAELGNRMHFGLHIQATGGAQFRISDLSFTESSTDPVTAADPPNGLSWSWTGLNVYSGVRIGVRHTANGTVILDNNQAGTELVDEFFYLGAGDAFWPLCSGCTPSQQQAAIDSVAASLGDYTFSGTYSIQGFDSAGAPMGPFSATGSFDIDAVPEPSTFVLAGSFLVLAGLRLKRRRTAL